MDCNAKDARLLKARPLERVVGLRPRGRRIVSRGLRGLDLIALAPVQFPTISGQPQRIDSINTVQMWTYNIK